jgi:serine/threonine protein kinase
MDSKDSTGQPGKPGQVSKLLADIARAPDATDDGWAGALRPGARFGHFELLHEVARGGFGIVWEARDLELPRTVAFKALRPGPATRARGRQPGLDREAEAAALLQHPNICTLHAKGEGPGGTYLVLEMLHGATLADRQRRGPLPPAQALAIAIEVARALAHAHGRGVVHRDLKPGNVHLALLRHKFLGR